MQTKYFQAPSNRGFFFAEILSSEKRIILAELLGDAGSGHSSELY